MSANVSLCPSTQTDVSSLLNDRPLSGGSGRGISPCVEGQSGKEHGFEAEGSEFKSRLFHFPAVQPFKALVSQTTDWRVPKAGTAWIC